jgi:hypothetical protein
MGAYSAVSNENKKAAYLGAVAYSETVPTDELINLSLKIRQKIG